MRKEFMFFCFSLFAVTCLHSQNVGIGTATPTSRLDVVGSEATNHGKNAAITITNTASTNSWILRAGAVGTSTPKAGFSIADNVAYRLIIDSTGQVGIGDLIPLAPLSVKCQSYGNKIILQGSSVNNHYGIGVDISSLLQIYTNGNNSDIGFGYGSSNNFTETMRIRGNGNVGIGTTVPLRKLDIKGNACFNDSTIYLRAGYDLAHGLQYNSSVDGPYLFGFAGGALGTYSHPNSLTWDWSGNVAGRSNLLIDTAGGNNGDLNNTLRFGGWTGEAIGSKRTLGGNRYGLDFYTGNINRMSITNSGFVGIGNNAPTVPLQFASSSGNKIALYQSGNNYYGLGTQTSLLQIYTPTSGDDIAFGYGNSTSFTENIRMDGSGSLSVKTNMTVQNGKGIIRNSDGTQQKKLTTIAIINATFAAGETKSFTVIWPEAFGGVPDAFIGSVVSGSNGWAEIILTVVTPSTTGALVHAYNPKSVAVSPNYGIKIIAIGPQ